ncbi:MAG: phosphomannomutase/phosphoglucomutase [Sphaerochaeta sp.]
MGAFKAYDIRGVFGKDIDEDLAYKVGFFLPKLLKTNEVLVGRDIRLSSDSLYEALTQGVMDSGNYVISIGRSTTPMVYFSTVYYHCKASVQITASHNPKEYNGLKISREFAIPVGGETGLKELEQMVNNEPIVKVPSDKRGTVKVVDAKKAYLEFLRKYQPDFSNLKLAIDCSNGVAPLIVKDLLGPNHIYLNFDMDGTFPNHEPNPLDPTTCEQLQKAVVDNKCDLGIIYDGDADRVMFIDEKGTYINADHAMALLGEKMIDMPGEKIAVCDIRTSKSTTDYLAKLGFEIDLWKVGHVNAKSKLRETGAVFGGELAGHYYFKEFNNCDSAMFATLMMLSVVSNHKREGKSFSEVMKSIIHYESSGEINFKINDKDKVMETLKDVYAKDCEKLYDFDGYRIEYPTWWFNIRKSNTEPYLRLVAEAATKKELAEKLEELKQYIHD